MKKTTSTATTNPESLIEWQELYWLAYMICKLYNAEPHGYPIFANAIKRLKKYSHIPKAYIYGTAVIDYVKTKVGLQ